MDENIAKIHQIVRANRGLTMRSIADLWTDIDRETVWKVLTKDLGMCKVCTQMILTELTIKKSKGGLNCAQTCWRGRIENNFGPNNHR